MSEHSPHLLGRQLALARCQVHAVCADGDRDIHAPIDEELCVAASRPCDIAENPAPVVRKRPGFERLRAELHEVNALAGPSSGVSVEILSICNRATEHPLVYRPGSFAGLR
jgi:hypothetical protein